MTHKDHLRRLIEIIENDDLMFQHFPPLVEAKKSLESEEQAGKDAISFAEWIQKSGWIKSLTNPGKILWFDGKLEMYDKPYITTSELYNIYKNKPQ